MNLLRRALLQQTVNVAGASIFFDTGMIERLTKALTRPSEVDSALLKYLEQRVLYYWYTRDHALLSADNLLLLVAHQLRALTTLLEGSLFPNARKDLSSIAGKTALLYGVLLYDLRSHYEARTLHSVASQAAKAAGDQALEALCLGWMSFTWISTKEYTQALPCIQEAKYVALQLSDKKLSSWLSAIDAEIQAHLGNKEECLHALEQGENDVQAPSVENTYPLFKMDVAQFQGFKGACLQHLYQHGDPTTYHFLQDAKEALDRAVISDAPGRRKLTYFCDLASAYARQGEIEAACLSAAQSVRLFTQSNSKVAAQRLFEMRHLLQSYMDTPYVKALDEQMVRMLSPMAEGYSL